MSLQRTVLLLSKITAVVIVLAVAYLLSGRRVYIANGKPGLGPAAEAPKEVQRPGPRAVVAMFRDFPSQPLRNINASIEKPTPEDNVSLPPDDAEKDLHHKENDHEITDHEVTDSVTYEVTAFNDKQRDGDMSIDQSNVNEYVYQADDKELDTFSNQQTGGTAALNFTIRSGFKFPHPQVFLPVATVLGAQWVQQLKDYLITIHPARSLTITVATKPFIPNLLNWLMASQLLVDPPIKHVLALGFEKDVHQLLASKNIPSIHVPMNLVVRGQRKGVGAVWMTRFAVLRLLNHWGYDVLQLDSDAVPLKNPDFLFNAYPEYDIVSARGILPFELGRGPWGFTVCMGAALLRATQKMGEIYSASMLHPPPRFR